MADEQPVRESAGNILKIEFNLLAIKGRADDSLRAMRAGDLDLIKAELYYLRRYLDQIDEALKKVL